MHKMHVLTMNNLQNQWNMCVVSSRVENEKSYLLLCNSSVVPVRTTGKFSCITLPKLHCNTAVSQVTKINGQFLVKDEGKRTQ